VSARDFALPPELEALLQEVCAEHGIPRRRHDELRQYLMRPTESWPACCRGSCSPCVDEQASVAREVLARYRERHP